MPQACLSLCPALSGPDDVGSDDDVAALTGLAALAALGIEDIADADASSDADIGARVAEARVARGLTCARLEELVELGTGQVSEIESGERRVDISELVRLASALDVTVRQLLGHAERPALVVALLAARRCLTHLVSLVSARRVRARPLSL